MLGTKSIMGDPLVVAAAEFACIKHAGQFRKYNFLPYITHPIRVASRTAIELKDADCVAAAYCHDLAEDCAVLESRFGMAVAALVEQLTNPSKQHPQLSRAERKAMDREHARLISPEAQTIKLIDRIDNLAEIDFTDKFAILYCEESRLLLPCLAGGDLALQRELQGDIENVQFAADLHRRGL